jgi:hypothetical protein
VALDHSSFCVEPRSAGLLKHGAALTRKRSGVASTQECRQSINLRGVLVFGRQSGGCRHTEQWCSRYLYKARNSVTRTYAPRMRDNDTIDSELRLVAALRSADREGGGPLPSIDAADALLDERRELAGNDGLDVYAPES